MTRIAAGLAVAVLLAACTDRPHPTGVDPADVGVVAAETSTLSVALLSPALIPIEDALGRVLNGLPDAPAKDGLRAALYDLAAALEANDGCAVRNSRSEAEHALRDLGRGAPAEFEPDLEVTQLALESVEETAGGRCDR